MKRGKDDEKIIGPMFPRLHVNDTEKGGPRAPPRNKMALYEQLSIPSQRFNPGILPLKPNNSSNLIPPPSSSQVNSSDRNVFIPLHLPPSMPTFLPESFNGSESGRVSVMTSFPRVEQRVNTGTEDDCAVPVFVQSGGGYGKSPISKSSENFPPLNPNYAIRTMTSSACSNDPKHCNPNANLRPGVRRVATEPKQSSSDRGEKSSENSPKVGSTDRALKAVDESKNQKEARLQTGNSARDYGLEESLRQNEMRLASNLRRDSPAGDVQSGNDGEQLRDERSDDGSDASIVDSVSAMDISPDDVVGIIGQKHFWKARRAIVNQQRVFAVQVFELHRLIKVQKLIAGSPHLLLEDASGLSKPSSKISPAEKVAEEGNAKSPSSAVVKHRDEPSKPSHPVECSAENAVGKPLTAANRSTPPEPTTPDARMESWGGQSQPAGNHQWLIPVMSPTEGLVYKPYPGNGFSGGGIGGFGPYGAPPMMGNYANPVYGVPAHPHQPFLPGVPHGGHSYFPTYGVPIMPTPIQGQGSEQTSCFPEPVSCVQTGTVSFGNTNHQSSCTAPIPRAAASAPTKLHISKEPDFQGSTPSSPVKRAEEIPTVSASEQVNCAVSKQPPNRNSYNLHPSSPGERLEGFRPILGKDGRKGALSLFPVVAVDADQPARVIKAVPHNPRSASETVARIFRSIQEERKQYDST